MPTLKGRFRLKFGTHSFGHYQINTYTTNLKGIEP